MRPHPLVFVPMTAVLALGEVSATERLVSLRPEESLRVVDAGAGPPVVLVPGLLGSAFGFRHVVPELAAAGYRAIVIEPLGVGASSKPARGDYSLTAQADRIAGVLEVLDVEPAVLVAHSLGASMAFRLACRHPERVRAIVSLDGGPAEAAATPGFRRAMRFAPLLKLSGGRLIRGAVRQTLETRSADPRWVTDEVVRGYMEAASQDLSGALDAYRGMARAREPEALGPRLKDVRCPVRLLLGAVPHGGAPTEREIGLLRERLVSFAVEEVPGAGHFVFEENPGAVVAAVRSLGDRQSVRKERS